MILSNYLIIFLFAILGKCTHLSWCMWTLHTHFTLDSSYCWSANITTNADGPSSHYSRVHLTQFHQNAHHFDHTRQDHRRNHVSVSSQIPVPTYAACVYVNCECGCRNIVINRKFILNTLHKYFSTCHIFVKRICIEIALQLVGFLMSILPLTRAVFWESIVCANIIAYWALCWLDSRHDIPDGIDGYNI